ncbi:MAG: ligase-associated DNA damage response exonuclease [Akkermansiaceae bacterium]|nr:ligase-associated DNA damage response exonuclease [Akkermansiaceae bacterium]
MDRLIQESPEGIYCPAGGFYVDPWKPADFAVITHGHSDHARWGSKKVLTAESGTSLVQARVGNQTRVQGIPFGETLVHKGVKISLHPAGHILGSAQVRLEHKGEVAVISGDYKTQADPTCEDFEPVPCHTFITESTFGLPIYRWQPHDILFEEINGWWRNCQAQEKTAVIFAYALGKAQRILGGVDRSIGPILVHGAVHRFLEDYQQQGIDLPEAAHASVENAKSTQGRALLVAPPSAMGTPWLKKFRPLSLAFASGWMAVRGTRRRRSMDKGFVVSDHADWEGLLGAIETTGAERIGVTHGHGEVLVRWLQEQGKEAWKLKTRFAGEAAEDPSSEESEEFGEDSS